MYCFIRQNPTLNKNPLNHFLNKQKYIISSLGEKEFSSHFLAWGALDFGQGSLEFGQGGLDFQQGGLSYRQVEKKVSS